MSSTKDETLARDTRHLEQVAASLRGSALIPHANKEMDRWYILKLGDAWASLAGMTMHVEIGDTHYTLGTYYPRQPTSDTLHPRHHPMLRRGAWSGDAVPTADRPKPVRISKNKSASTIAAEIERRWLPSYAKAYKLVEAAMQRFASHVRQTEKTWRAISGPPLREPSEYQRRDNCVLASIAMVDTDDVRGDVTVHGSEVELKIQGADAELARIILEAIQNNRATDLILSS